MAAPDAKPRRVVRNGGPGAAWSLPALAARTALAARRLGRGDRPGLLVDPGGADRHRPAPAGPGLPLGARALRTVHPGLRRHPFPVDLDPLAPGLRAAGRVEGDHRRRLPGHRHRPLAAAAAAACAASSATLADANARLTREVAERREAEQRARGSEARLAGFFEHQADALFVVRS